LISAAPFRDRVVHHALCNVLEPVFEPSFIHDTYACRIGRGTHAALDRASSYARRYRYVLKGDIRKFFPSIDHAILKELIARKVKDPHVLWLVRVLIDGSNEQEPVLDWFPGDDLFTPLERRRGLPLGNQTSQFFANVYLSPFDHFLKDRRAVPGYVRYCDDFLVFSNDKSHLHRMREDAQEQLGKLRLSAHDRKCQIAPTASGIRFLGCRIFPTHRVLLKENVRRVLRRIKRFTRAYAEGKMTTSDIASSLRGWIAHAGHADTHQLRVGLLREARFVRGDAVSSSVARRVVEQHREQPTRGLPQQEHAVEP
jgi:retron-type reverse transcriptase